MIDYCDTPAEIAKNPDAKKWLQDIAMGDVAAFTFCWTMWNFTHAIDDLVDKDVPQTPDDFARCVGQLFHTLTFNPFYLAYHSQLHGLMISMLDRWVHSEPMMESTDRDEVIRGTVVRCGDLDLYVHVAYLVGGWDHMRAMQGIRSYDPPDAPEA